MPESPVRIHILLSDSFELLHDALDYQTPEQTVLHYSNEPERNKMLLR